MGRRLRVTYFPNTLQTVDGIPGDLRDDLFAPTGTQTRIDNQDPQRFRAASRSPRQAVK